MSRRGHYKMLTLKSKGMDEGTLQKCRNDKKNNIFISDERIKALPDRVWRKVKDKKAQLCTIRSNKIDTRN